MQKRIAIIDYELGNLFSVRQACLHVGLDPFITHNPSELMEADGAILPGVGAFGDAMANLQRFDMVSAIHDFVAAGKPFMGICLGMQLLFTESEEFGTSKGLSLIEGQIQKFPSSKPFGGRIKVPQIGWNQIWEAENRPWDETPLRGLPNGAYMYFVHSYFANPVHKKDVFTWTAYEDIRYCSSVRDQNIFACQFHPEKSGKIGLGIYQKWSEMIGVNELVYV